MNSPRIGKRRGPMEKSSNTIGDARQTPDPKTRNNRGRLPSHGRVREVLIVDDEEPFLLSIEDGLCIYKKYFTLCTATNGIGAIKVLKGKRSIDLVITDLSMPGMDGFELLAYIKRNYRHIPVILMTAYGTPRVESITRSMGVFSYLEKPLDINIIADNIFGALSIQYP
ncbi:MAG: response regulator [Deltaproteobacteria bacterium]|nr:response regulator [Deltaproteobacteria bacterium]